jgi:hypothetical protein
VRGWWKLERRGKAEATVTIEPFDEPLASADHEAVHAEATDLLANLAPGCGARNVKIGAPIGDSV